MHAKFGCVLGERCGVDSDVGWRLGFGLGGGDGGEERGAGAAGEREVAAGVVGVGVGEPEAGLAEALRRGRERES